MSAPSRTRTRSPLILEEAVLRPRQAQIFAQRRAFIFAAVDAAPLQLRYHLVDEIVEPGRQEREHDVEAVAAARDQPFLHLVGDGFWRADKGEPAIAAD